MRYIVIILEKGNLPHPRFPRFDILVPWAALNGLHPNTTQCAKGSERNWHRLATEEMRDSKEHYLWQCGRPLILMSYFKYLVGVLTASEYFWPVLVGNLKKEWKKWERLSIFLGR